MSPATSFEITRRNLGAGNASGIYDSAAPRGLALGADSSDATKFALAKHDNFIGFLTRDVVVGGLTVNDRIFGRTSASPVGLEAPFTAGECVSVEKAFEIECEGSDYLLLTGTGLISAATTIPQALSFLNGKLRCTQSGEVVNAFLTANSLTPATAGELRIRAEMA